MALLLVAAVSDHLVEAAVTNHEEAIVAEYLAVELLAFAGRLRPGAVELPRPAAVVAPVLQVAAPLVAVALAQFELRQVLQVCRVPRRDLAPLQE